MWITFNWIVDNVEKSVDSCYCNSLDVYNFVEIIISQIGIDLDIEKEKPYTDVYGQLFTFSICSCNSSHADIFSSCCSFKLSNWVCKGSTRS